MPTNLRWVHVCIISLLVLVCVWLLFTRGEEVFPGHTQPYRLPLLPFVLLAIAVLFAAGWHRRLMPHLRGVRPTDGGRLLWTGAIVAFWVLSLPLWHQLGARVNGEGIAYYVYLRSAVFDGDLDFSNEYEAFNLDDDDPELLSPTPTGLPRNAHAVGPAVVWSPFLLAGHAVQSLPGDSTELTPFGAERRKREAVDQDALGLGYSYPFVTAWRRDRTLTGVYLSLLLAMVYVNGAVADWWAMDSFGHRRFAGLYPVFAWGLSAAFASLKLARWRRPFCHARGGGRPLQSRLSARLSDGRDPP